MNNQIEIVVHRDDVKLWLGIDLDDEQWYALSAEIEDVLQEEIIPNYVTRFDLSHINDLVEEERKYA